MHILYRARVFKLEPCPFYCYLLSDTPFSCIDVLKILCQESIAFLSIASKLCRSNTKNIMQVVAFFFIASKLCGSGTKNIMET